MVGHSHRRAVETLPGSPFEVFEAKFLFQLLMGLLANPSRSSSRSCWISIFCETSGMAFSNSEKRKMPRANRWKIITIFQRPSSMRNAHSIPRAAMSGVTFSSLPVGEYPTFRCVLAT